jgi:ribose 5-phosphate isomerase RpiB
MYDGYMYADAIGQAIGNHVISHFRSKGFELSTLAYTINQTEQYPTYLGYMVCSVKGIKDLNGEPTFT